MAPRTFTIRFDMPDTDTPCYAGDYKGALGFAPTLATARFWTDADVAQSFLVNGYGKVGAWGRVIEVKAGQVVA